MQSISHISWQLTPGLQSGHIFTCKEDFVGVVFSTMYYLGILIVGVIVMPCWKSKCFDLNQKNIQTFIVHAIGPNKNTVISHFFEQSVIFLRWGRIGACDHQHTGTKTWQH